MLMSPDSSHWIQTFLSHSSPATGLPDLFPSYFEDWVDPQSVVGLVVVVHADIGELIHHDHTHSELRNASIFFFKYVYVPPSGHRLYGKLEEIPLPGFGSVLWPLPDINTSEAFWFKIRLDFRSALKPSTGSRRSHLQWFVPFTVFMDLFASARSIIQSPTMFTIKILDDQVMGDLMDKRWSSRTTTSGDQIWCTVSLPSVVFRYHIACQTLYVNFFFTRERAVGRQWVPMEHKEGVQLVLLTCEVMGSNPPILLNFNIGLDWPISHLRNEVQIAMGHAAPTEFGFVVTEPGKQDRKVNRCRESIMTVSDVLAPCALKLKNSDT